jgi:glyoxylase-like metal-dependent hydrolase (beta-lactamase superfamily II)
MRNPTWRILHIGYLRRNSHGAEEVSDPAQECTCTLIETEKRRVLVDPGLDRPEKLETALQRYGGLRPEEIDTVFLTHFHHHHWRCLSLFPKAVWLMSRTEIRWWQHRGGTDERELDVLARLVPIEEFPIEGIESLPTPGHTHGLTSLMFETREGIVIVAGDAVLTFDHFDEREPPKRCDDVRMARRSIDQIAKMADLVIPGHDNYFVV